MPQSDPYAEFGGQMIQATPVANDPYAEFGGQTISAQPSESAFVTNRPQLPTPAEVIAPIAQSMQPFGASGPAAGKLTGLPGVNPHSPTGAEVAGDVALASSHEIAGPASRVVGQTVKGAVKAAPYLALSEGINYARKNLPMNMGKYIPPGAEWVLPLLVGGGKGAAAGEAAETTAATAAEEAPAATAAAEAEGAAAAEPKGTEVELGNWTKEKSAPYQGRSVPEMQLLDSTTISKAGYAADKKQLVVEFRNGNVYSLRGVPQKIADGFMESESHGAYYSKNIKGRYATERWGTTTGRKY